MVPQSSHVQRANYVEYCLTGLLYGLRQEVLARRGPIDPNHYWYEFITALSRIRVDGTLTGEDGNLTQTEVITFRFAAALAPVFWVLRPLFIRQKRDILADDTALLEREYQLECRGFQRHEPHQQRIVVYGGNGSLQSPTSELYSKGAILSTKYALGGLRLYQTAGQILFKKMA